MHLNKILIFISLAVTFLHYAQSASLFGFMGENGERLSFFQRPMSDDEGQLQNEEDLVARFAREVKLQDPLQEEEEVIGRATREIMLEEQDPKIRAIRSEQLQEKQLKIEELIEEEESKARAAKQEKLEEEKPLEEKVPEARAATEEKLQEQKLLEKIELKVTATREAKLEEKQLKEDKPLGKKISESIAAGEEKLQETQNQLRKLVEVEEPKLGAAREEKQTQSVEAKATSEVKFEEVKQRVAQAETLFAPEIKV